MSGVSPTPDSQITAADLERAFRGKIPRVRVPIMYRAGLLVVSISLVLLQAAYVFMVALAAWLTYVYVTLIPGIIESVHVNWLSIVLIATPLVVGFVVTFFLLKPLLSRPPKAPEPMELPREDAPILFDFVDRVCSMIGAPTPKRIDVDLQVNASASLRRGLRSLAGNDLRLTIGLPLVAGLTTRQFAGVLGHEFGHFTQSVGMRLYFLIWSVRYWFTRVAYERDHWDLRLEQAVKGSGWRTKLILGTAQLAVRFSRFILRGLLRAATWISAWFSRHMEFDADQHEAALVGANTCKETFRRLQLLSVACQSSWNDINQAWSRKRLAEDFPALVRHRDAGIPEATQEDIWESLMAETTQRWATHPATRERIEHVASIAGTLTEPLDQPASMLFRAFPDVCRRATLHQYRINLSDALKKAEIVPSHAFLTEVTAATERAAAQQILFGNINTPSRWFVLPETNSPSAEKSIYLSVDADPSEGYWNTLEQSIKQNAALEFLRAGGRIQPEAFELSSEDIPAAEEAVRASREALQTEIQTLRTTFGSNGDLLSRAASELWTAYAAVSAAQPALLELRYALAAHQLLVGNLNLLELNRAASARKSGESRLVALCRDIIHRLNAIPCPVAMAGTENSPLDKQLLPGKRPDVFNNTPALDLARTVLNRSDEVAEFLLGELCRESKRVWEHRGDSSTQTTNN
jgi:Zn-dependent protease with chaperone function